MTHPIVTGRRDGRHDCCSLFGSRRDGTPCHTTCLDDRQDGCQKNIARRDGRHNGLSRRAVVMGRVSGAVLMY